MYGRKTKLSKRKLQKQSEENTLKNNRNLFTLKEENKETKYRITRDIRTFFEQENDYYNWRK